MNKMLRVSSSLISVFLLLNLFGCATTEKTSDTPEGAFQIAEEFEKAERYDQAISRYTEVKNKFPYSNWATKAELAIADVHYKDESYVEAQLSYQAFRDLHPKHELTPYVLYKITLSFFQQLPTTTDRDLSVSADILKSANEFLEKFPQSEYAKEVREKKDSTLHMLAEKEDYVGHFYFKREMFDSAQSRYEGLLQKYSGQGFDEKALSRLVVCAEKLGDKPRAQKYFSTLKEKFPDSKELDAARKVLQE